MARTTKNTNTKAATKKAEPKTEAPATKKGDEKTEREVFAERFATAVATPTKEDANVPDPGTVEAVVRVATEMHGSTRSAATKDAFAEAVESAAKAADMAKVSRATAVRSAVDDISARSTQSSAAPIPHDEILAARVLEFATILSDAIDVAEDNGVDVDGALGTETAERVRALVAKGHDYGDDEAAKKAAWKRTRFGGQRPDATKVGRGGGSRTTANRELDAVPDGPITWTTNGTTHEAAVDGSVIVTEDGEKHATPSGACKHLTGASVNGWVAWKRDGHDLASIHDGDDGDE